MLLRRRMQSDYGDLRCWGRKSWGCTCIYRRVGVPNRIRMDRDAARDCYATLISNQVAPYEPAWTSFFIGERKCSSMGCATIQSDGSVLWNAYATYQPNRTSPTPVALSAVTQTWGCGWGVFDLNLTVWPTGYNALTGSKPTGWALRDYSTHGACN